MTSAAWCGLVLGLLGGGPSVASDPAPAWSPDGHWIAYTLELPDWRRSLPGSWLNAQSSDPAPEIPGAPTFRLYATRPETGESALLAESSHPLSSPTWNPDGTALAFSRMTVEAGKGRIEVVVQDAPESRHVVHAEAVGDPVAAGAWLAGKRLAWSPDGKYLVVPQFAPAGLAILRADQGNVLKRLEGAFSPSWSPDAAKLAFYRAGDPDGLFWLDTNFAEPRHLIDTPQAARMMPPLWSRDGQILSFVKHDPSVVAPQPRLQAARGKPSLSLIRIHLENGQIESLRALNHEPIPPGESFRDVSVVTDVEGEEMYYTTWVDGQRSQITWSRPRSGEVRRRFNPLDETTTLTALSLSPTSRTLALRLGPPGVSAPVVVYVPESDRFIPMVPDDAARAAWVGFILQTLQTTLSEWPARPDVTNPPIDRTTPLPVPGDNVEEPAAANRAARLSRFGRPLCDGPADLGPIDPEFALRLDEAKLVFDYLRSDYTAALDDLDALEGRRNDRRSSLQELVIRTQIAIGLGNLDQARDTLKYLREIPSGPSQILEETLRGPYLTDVPNADAAWLTCLSDIIAQRAGAADESGPASSHPNPDAPDFEPPDEVIDNVVPMPIPPFRRVPRMFVRPVPQVRQRGGVIVQEVEVIDPPQPPAPVRLTPPVKVP
jgi:hypothetical protein